MVRQTAGQVQDEAARWIARMDKIAWGEMEEAELRHWLDADPRRAGALLQAQAAWATLDGLAFRASRREGVRDFGGDVAGVRSGPRGIDWSRRRFLIGGGGAAVAASLAGLVLFDRAAHYETEVGEIRRVPLADGSTMAINTASLATVDLEKTRRLVRIERGELWFQVAKDPKRPFVVEVGRVRVQAVGTAFAVRRREAGVDIFVTEGIVEVWAEGGVAPRTRIAAGEHAFIADNASVVHVPATATSVYRALAWREGKIDLAGVTLGEAAAEFNRYNRRKLVIVDPAIAGEAFDGILRTDDIEGFAMAIRDSLAVPVDLRDPSEIRVGRSKK